MKNTIGLKYRYPGVNPFRKKEKFIFFGREKEVDQLLKRIELEELLVLFSKSGIGKSSLLEAGLLPKVEQSNTFLPIYIRFGAYQAGETLSPLEATFLAVKDKEAKYPWLEKLVNGKETLWQLLKARQIKDEQSSRVLLIFDQFEEIFSYPPKEIEAFKKALSEVLYEEIPQAVRLKLKQKDALKKENIPKNELAFLYQPFEKRVLLAIRSDRMSLLNELSDYIPNILKGRFELRPLTLMQAADAIKQPAKIIDPHFESNPFRYKKDALKKMLNLLSKNGSQPIESFQLQILCNNIERRMITTQLTEVSMDDIGDVEKIYENYYDNQIKSLELESLHDPIRLLLENEFIFEDEKRRLSLSVGQVKRFMDEQLQKETPEEEIEKLLNQLVKTRLVRREQSNRSKGSYLYELSHDTMVAPLLSAKSKRTDLEERHQLETERIANIEAQRKANHKRMATAIVILVVVSCLVGIWAIVQKDAVRNAEKYAINIQLLLDEAKESAKEVDKANANAKQQQKLTDKALNTLVTLFPSSIIEIDSTNLDSTKIKTQSNEELLKKIIKLVGEKQKEEKELKTKQNDYEEKLNSLIEELFTKGNRNETKRNKARKNLILEYPNDPMMITRLLEKASEDNNFENGPSLWQMLYILDNLPIQSLYVKKEGIKIFFQKGSSKNLWGDSSQKTIWSIKSKWKKYDRLVN